MFSAQNIRWVRNVKRDEGRQWAYMESSLDDEFDLNWSSGYKADAELPKIGDIILLFQRPDKIKGVTANVYLTHLVTPLDNTVWDLQTTNPQYRWARRVAVIAKVNHRTVLSKPLSWSFSPVNQVHSYRLRNIRIRGNHEADRTQTLQNEIWRFFTPYFRPDYEKYIQQQQIVSDDILDITAEEGRRKLVEHLLRERDRGIVKLAKQIAIKSGKGRVKCECCNFDFTERYGAIGKGFIECHHRIPINKGVRVTRLEDLAMVCANCHRMLHKQLNGKFISINELRLLINRGNA